MADRKKVSGPFHAAFVYTEDILNDFEALYLEKKKLPLKTRLICILLGIAGVLYFGWDLKNQGFGIARVGYLAGCSMLLLVGVSARKSRPDDSIKKYRKHYTGYKADFTIDENGVEMKLEKQRNKAQSKFEKIYGLYETKLCFYLVISGKAYYIIPKRAVTGGTADELRSYLEAHCKKRFLYYELEQGEKQK